MHSNGIRGELAFYFFAPLSTSLFCPFFLLHLLPFLQEDRYHFVEGDVSLITMMMLRLDSTQYTLLNSFIHLI